MSDLYCTACGHDGEHHLWDTCDVEDVPMADGRLRNFCGCPGYEPTERAGPSTTDR